MSEKIDTNEIKDAKDGLAKAEPVSHEKLTTILKCKSCGKEIPIPDNLQAKMDADEDISGMLPACECGGETALAVKSV